VFTTGFVGPTEKGGKKKQYKNLGEKKLVNPHYKRGNRKKKKKETFEGTTETRKSLSKGPLDLGKKPWGNEAWQRGGTEKKIAWNSKYLKKVDSKKKERPSHEEARNRGTTGN